MVSMNTISMYKYYSKYVSKSCPHAARARQTGTKGSKCRKVQVHIIVYVV